VDSIDIIPLRLHGSSTEIRTVITQSTLQMAKLSTEWCMT
jgi:hypothetical protein